MRKHSYYQTHKNQADAGFLQPGNKAGSGA